VLKAKIDPLLQYVCR